MLGVYQHLQLQFLEIHAAAFTECWHSGGYFIDICGMACPRDFLASLHCCTITGE